MKTRGSLGIVLLVAWFGSAAEIKQPEYRQPNYKRRGRSLGDPRNPCFRATDTPLGACVITNVGQHPWLIRFKFDVDPLKVPYVLHNYKGLFDEYTKNLTSESVGSKNYHTLMTGVLVSTTKVLTTTVWRGMFEEMLARGHGFFSNHFILMYGYNSKENCHQARHAKTAIWHPRSNKGYFLGLLGDFGLYEPWQPFEVEGQPFLLQNPHPLAQIEQTITALIAKPKQLLMFLFYNSTGIDGRLLDEKGSMFDFIGLPECRQMPNFKLQEKVHFEPDATNRSFFCGPGIKGAWNESDNGTYEGRGQDGNVGAVAFYKDKTGKLLPLGLYDYWIGASGEPRFFAAFTKIFFDWFDTAQFPQPRKLKNLRKSENHRSGPRSSDIIENNPPIELRSRKSKELAPDFTASPINTGGRRRHSGDFWIAIIAILTFT